MTRTARRTARAITTGLALAVGIAVGHMATTTPEMHGAAVPQCGELAVWEHVVDRHGEDGAHRVWAAMVADGWTNLPDGDPTFLVPAGCAHR